MSVLKIKDANGKVTEILAIKGEKGDNYVLTEEDKQEIAGMVSGGGSGGSNVDLSNYYTKEETDAAISKAEAGDVTYAMVKSAVQNAVLKFKGSDINDEEKVRSLDVHGLALYYNDSNYGPAPFKEGLIIGYSYCSETNTEGFAVEETYRQIGISFDENNFMKMYERKMLFATMFGIFVDPIEIYEWTPIVPTLTSPNGTKYKLTVDDSGTLSATAL